MRRKRGLGLAFNGQAPWSNRPRSRILRPATVITFTTLSSRSSLMSARMTLTSRIAPVKQTADEALRNFEVMDVSGQRMAPPKSARRLLTPTTSTSAEPSWFRNRVQLAYGVAIVGFAGRPLQPTGLCRERRITNLKTRRRMIRQGIRRQEISGLDRRPSITSRQIRQACASTLRNVRGPSRSLCKRIGTSWNFRTLLVVPAPPSTWNGALVLKVAHSPLPFHPASGSSMRPSIHLVEKPRG